MGKGVDLTPGAYRETSQKHNPFGTVSLASRGRRFMGIRSLLPRLVTAYTRRCVLAKLARIPRIIPSR